MRSLGRDTAFYGLTVLAERLTSFLVVPILTKVLSQARYGVWSQFIVTAPLISGLLLLGFQTSIVRFLSGNQDERKTSYVFHGMSAVVLLNSMAALLVLVVFSRPLGHVMFGDRRFSHFVPLFAVFLVTETLLEMVLALLRSQNRIRLLSIYYLAKTVLRVLLLGVGIRLAHRTLFQTISLIVAMQFVLIGLVYLKDVVRTVGFRFAWRECNWGTILSFSVPLALYGLVAWGNNFIGRYFILHFLNLDQVGVYAVASSLAGITGLSHSIVGFSAYPYVVKLWNEGDRGGAAGLVEKAIRYHLLFSIPTVFLITVLNAPLTKLISTDAYVANGQVVFWLTVGVVLFGIYQFSLYPLLLMNETLLNLYIGLGGLGVQVLSSLLLIPRMGILGAALAIFVSNLSLLLLTSAASRKFLRMAFPWDTVCEKGIHALAISALLVWMRSRLRMGTLDETVVCLLLGAGAYVALDLLGRKSLFCRLSRSL